MASLPAGVDPTALDDLKAAAETYSLFQKLGEPVEFWEIVRLAKANRSLLTYQLSAPERNRSTLEPILEELKPIRQQLSTTVRNLRTFIEKAPGRPDSPERLELALSFLLASAKEQQIVARWLAEPDKNLRKAGQKLSAIASIADPYREALLPWRLPVSQPKPAIEAAAAVFHLDAADSGGAPALDEDMADPFDSADLEPLIPLDPADGAAPSPVFEVPTAAEGPKQDIDVDPAVLDDLRLMFRCRSIFEETVQPSDVWELLMLCMAERSKTRQTLEEIARSREQKKPAKFHEGARNLYTRVLAIRSKEAVWVRPLRDFLTRLPLGAVAKDTLEMALALLVVSSIGRKEAKKWLDEPGRHVDDALSRMKYLMAQAQSYQAAVWRA